MKRFRGGILAVSVIIVLIALVNIVFSQNNFFNELNGNKLLIESGFKTKTERICADNFDKKTCVDNVIVYCNGQTLKIPKSITGYIIHDKVFVKENQNECVNENNIIIKNNKKNGTELPSPKDRIEDDQIRVYNNRVVINIRDAKWRTYIDSNSMDPIIDDGTKTIEIKPNSAEDIQVGDIMAYDDGYDYAVVHRVVEIGEDSKGIYFITKGDNLKFNDEEKVRFGQVEGIVVGIIY